MQVGSPRRLWPAAVGRHAVRSVSVVLQFRRVDVDDDEGARGTRREFNLLIWLSIRIAKNLILLFNVDWQKQLLMCVKDD